MLLLLREGFEIQIDLHRFWLIDLYFLLSLLLQQLDFELEEEEEVVATIKWHFTLLCYQEIILCNLDSCSWEVWMGAFMS